MLISWLRERRAEKRRANLARMIRLGTELVRQIEYATDAQDSLARAGYYGLLGKFIDCTTTEDA